MAEMTFTEKAQQAVEHSIIDLLRKGDWLMPPAYNQRIAIDLPLLRQAYAAIDMARVISLATTKIEERIADSIINHMATEVATDVKKIMCNTELREDLRALLRDKIRAAAKGLEK